MTGKITSRRLRYGTASYGSILKSNQQHYFAASNAMMIYKANALYTLIPKNACSTIRLSIAMANGAISSPADARWIHNNNDAFRPSLAELAQADYCFALLRCPFARLASCFLDKFVSRNPVAWDFKDNLDEDIDLARLTFRRFCTELTNKNTRLGNKHWRPQVDFLVYEDYDDLFCVEEFGIAARTLSAKIGLEIHDSRPYLKHDTSRFSTLPASRSFADTEVWQIESLMMAGLRPDPRNLYDDEIRDIVATAYAQDLKLHRSLFPGRGLFDEPAASAVTGKAAAL